MYYSINFINQGDYKAIKFGRYLYLKRNKLEEAINRFEPEKNIVALSELHIKYLVKIIEFCKEKNIQLIFITTPHHKYFLEKNNSYIQTINSYIYSFVGNHTYLDFSSFKFPSDEYYGDLTHLNYKGATYFSKSIKDSLSLLHNKNSILNK